MKEKTVVVGMSGGVDSSVSACLLKDEGYNVLGVTMMFLDNEETKKSIEDAKKICKQIGITHKVIDLRKEFKDLVIKNFIDSYQKGYTPNPCVVCNKYFKFGLFYEKAKELGANYIATGHYAKIENNQLKMSDIVEKDQSYFLSQINKDILPFILFPLNKYKSKEETRALARKYNLPVSEKKDSQEICFIPKNNYKDYLKENKINQKSGYITLKDHTILGKHTGLYNYTIGQRKGLNIAYKEPLYVIDLDTKTNTVIVGSNKDLYNIELLAKNMNYLVDKEDFLQTSIYAKIRSRGQLEEVSKIEQENNLLKITFKNPVRAITPGQYIVFYNKEKTCLGGATIVK